MKISKKKIIGTFVVIGIVLVLIFMPKNDMKDFSHKYRNQVDLEVDSLGMGRENTYADYLYTHTNQGYPDKILYIDVSDYTIGMNVETLSTYEGKGNVLITEEDSYVEWEIEVEESGMYQMKVNYFSMKARGVDIERKVYVNGEIPFLGADALSFSRHWTNKSEITRDNQGNDIRPSQVDIPVWADGYLKDDMGYYTSPYTFYLEKGKNTIGLEAINEPMAISQFIIEPVSKPLDYAQYQLYYEGKEINEKALTYIEVKQGEDAGFRSSPSLYPIYDRSAPNTVPYSVSDIRLNMIGGNAWRVAGQWIEWDFEVLEDGFYNISIKGRQNYNRGFVSTRTVYIDGVIPFEEVSDVGFRYSNVWENISLSDEQGIPYDFYLSKGSHTIRLEVTLGELGEILNDLSESVYRLNEIYRKILVLTGTTPDKYRDYKIEQVYPEVITAMDLESKRLFQMIDRITAYTGQKSSQASSLQTLAEQLEKFVEDPFKIPKMFTNFKDNISAMGTTILSLSESPLDIDYITITGKNVKPEKVNANFFTKSLHEIKSFVTSFTEDYNSVGDVHDKDSAIEVWILSGRDQSTVLKTMIDDTFTPNHKINVNVKLVEAATLLNAVLSGNGPDVVLSAAQGEPVNYALRNAVEDLTQFEGYEELLEAYYPSAYQSYIFEDGLYGLPETQGFSLLFYRTDILEELEVDVPKTWDDLIDILPVIQQNNMTVALPSGELSVLFAMIYQNGGLIYDEEGKKSLVDSEQGVEAFDNFTNFFTQYKLPKIYDFPNRFRSGEMPLGIADYSLYNTLVVFAPEIRGLWDFTLVPGTLKEDGTIDHSVHAGGNVSMILKQEDETVKNNSFEFLKWWANAQTQFRFGQEMESILGSSARYATANVEAFEQLSWSNTQMETLKEQWNWTVGYREIAGGYYTGRHILNAVRKVINDNDEPRETLLDYTRTINEEILKKRLEFGLDSR